MIIGVVLVALLVALRVADRRDARHGHRPRRMGDIRSASREQRRDLRTSRTMRYLPRVMPTDQGKQSRRVKKLND